MVDESPSGPKDAREDPDKAMWRLPTLQRNALCKIFDRPEFTPDEVAALGYRRLQQADGIGLKGLTVITRWLNAYGHDLPPPEPVALSKRVMPRHSRKNIETAVRLLRTHGYVVQPIENPDLPKNLPR